MPGKIKVKILAGRNLPVMDRSADTTDAYVEIKFGNTTYKTDVCRKSLNPQWNSEWYKFEVEDADLQDEPLQIRLMDHDTYSANDAIGKVYVNLNPLLLPGVPPPVKNIWTLEASMNTTTGSQSGSVMTGWLPVYDTMHGIRGEVNIIVKVELFLDFNKFRQSSCGVTFFYSPIVPHGYHAQVIHGFVEELVVCDDPEYKWIDKIRTPRASNEARQTLFLKLSNEVQRKIGLKALDLGGNAVIGYLQNFDLEGESGIVARGIGTVVTLVKLHDFPNFMSEAPTTEDLAPNSVKANNKAQSSDYSESDSSPRLPSHQHHHHHHHNHHNNSSNATANANNPNNNTSLVTTPTQLGSKFPVYGEKVAPTPLKFVEYKAPLLTRQMSIQSYTSAVGAKRNPLVSTSSLSLADDIIDESSLRSMLALEDMRGEPQGNRFSRGLRNLRYLPQSVLIRKNIGSLRSKGTLDSLDDQESDLESTYSSSWSICGSDTASIRSASLLDLQHSIKKKKFTHRKNSGEGMAAMLIRSVHASGLPLDIVKEDRETPTPSPVNFIDNDNEEESTITNKPEKVIPEESQSLVPDEDQEESPKLADPAEKSSKILLVTYSKLKLSSEDDDRAMIPMISSSESDTSSSDEDEDEPSESSTNYNILDDTLSLLDPSSPEAEGSQIRLFPSTTNKPAASLVSQLETKEEEDEEKVSLIDDKNEELPPPPPPPPLFQNKKDEILSSEFSSDVDSDMPASAIPYDYRTKRPTKKLSSPTRAAKSAATADPETRKKSRPEPLFLSLPPPPPPPAGYSEEKSRATPERSPKNSVNGGKVLRHHRVHKQLSVVQNDDNMSESSEDEYYTMKQQQQRNAKDKLTQEKKLLINLNDDELHQSSSTDQRGKSPRRVERTDTVIYKGPADKAGPAKEKNLLDTVNTESPSSPPPLVPIVAPPKPARSISNSGINNHLQVPTVNLRDIVPKSPYPTESPKAEGKSVFNFPDEARVAEMLMKKYRRSCMLELIKVIDSRMLHHHSHSDSTRRRRHVQLHKKNQTPSPDSVHRKIHHRRSRSRSPESNHHHHSKHHLAKSHHASSESIALEKPASTVTLTSTSSEPVLEESEEAVESLAQPKSPVQTPTEILEMHAIKPQIAALPKTNAPSPETKITNTANATDNLCVSHSPSTRRQQQNNQNQNQEVSQQQHQQQQQVTSISPAGTQQHLHQQQLHHQQQQQQKVASSPAARNPGIPLHRRSSDSDLSITPKGNSLTGSDRSMAGYLKPSSAVVRTMNQEALEMLEYPFITMQQYPPGFVLHIGGLVSARSVKLLERISNLEEPEGRDSWWTEIRMEVRSHARALACNVVIGYREETSICDDVCVLSGSGTAAVINLHSTGQDQDNVLITHVQGGPMTASMESDKICNTAPPPPAASIANNVTATDKSLNVKNTPETNPSPLTTGQQPMSSSVGNSSSIATTPGTNHHNSRQTKQRLNSESNEHDTSYVFPPSGCSLCHLPYNKSSMNFQVNVSKCAVCRRAKVPDVLFTTVELPEGIPMTGRGCFIQATVCKGKKDLRGELNAKEISDCLPFLEYELHSLLLNKLRVRGMNAVFGLKVQVSIGERLVIGMAVGTAVYLTALPPPSLPQIATGNSWHNEDQLVEIQKSLVETIKKNVEFYQLKPVPEVENGRSMSDTDESEDELPELDLGLGMKDVCVLEVDDVEDMDRISLLMDDRPPNDFHVVNTESIPGLEDLEIVRNLQMFTQVSRAKIPLNQSASMPSKYFARLLQTVYFKLRRMVPCALCDLQFKIAMPEQDEIQLSVVGMALGLGEPTRYTKFRRRILSHSMSKDQVKKQDDSDMIFSLDEDHAENGSTGETMPNVPNTPNTPNVQTSQTLNTGVFVQRPRPRSPLRIKHTSHRHKHVPLKERYGVDITPLSYLPGGRIERYLGHLNFFFIRESNSIRENGGLSGFIHSFVTEVLAIVRAHVTALGGNAMVAFFMTQCVLLHSPHKNQGQCLINVGGDVVNVSYFGNSDGKQQQASNTAGNC